jgi:hypothetical protein
VDGVTGYYVFWKNKKVRKLSKTSFVYKKSGAGKGTYKIVPYLAQSGKTFSGPGKTGKPKKNVIKFSGNSLNPKSYHGEICKFIVTKVELSGSTYKVTGYAINGSRNSTCEGFESLKITLKQSGKTVARKTVKKDFIIKPRSKKKLTFEIKGKSGKDLPGYGLKWNTVANEIFE